MLMVERTKESEDQVLGKQKIYLLFTRALPLIFLQLWLINQDLENGVLVVIKTRIFTGFAFVIISEDFLID